MTTPEPASLYDAHQDYLEAMRRQRRAPTTLRTYRLYGTRFVEFLHDRGIECPTLEHLTPDLVGKYQDCTRRQSRGSRDGASAEHHAVRSLKIFSRWLWRRNVFEVDPLARVEAPRLVRLHGAPFAKGDCALLLEGAQLGPNPIMERALLLLGLDTGARIGELCAADVEDLDLKAGTILFRKTKNGHPRRVLRSAAAVAILALDTGQRPIVRRRALAWLDAYRALLATGVSDMLARLQAADAWDTRFTTRGERPARVSPVCWREDDGPPWCKCPDCGVTWQPPFPRRGKLRTRVHDCWTSSQ